MLRARLPLKAGASTLAAAAASVIGPQRQAVGRLARAARQGAPAAVAAAGATREYHVEMRRQQVGGPCCCGCWMLLSVARFGSSATCRRLS